MFVPTEVYIKDDTQVLKLSNTLYSRPYYRLQDLERTDVRLRIPANIKKHYEAPQIVNILSHGINPVISPVSFRSILPWSRAVISPPTLTRFWYRQAYHVFNVFKGAVRLKALFFVDFDPFS